MYEVLVTLGVSFFAAVIIYVLYRRKSFAIWGFLASILIDFPILVLSSLGASNLNNIELISHTLGVFIFPIVLLILDILLIEISWFKYLRPFKYFLPNQIRTGVIIEKWLEKLQKYSALPHPERIKIVYMISILAGSIHVMINLIIGKLIGF